MNAETITLTPNQRERLTQVAQLMGVEAEKLLQEKANALIEELLEDLEDGAVVEERRRQMSTKGIRGVPWAEAKAHILADPEMANYSDSDEGERE